MQLQTHNVRYIVLHIIAPCDWRVMNHADKMEFNYLITTNNKKCPLAPLQPTDGCISVVYVGSLVYARRSLMLFSLLVELATAHPTAKIVDNAELYQPGNAVMSGTRQWLQLQLPQPLRELSVRYKNILFLQGFSILN